MFKSRAFSNDYSIHVFVLTSPNQRKDKTNVYAMYDFSQNLVNKMFVKYLH